eukprot:PhM_4_TR1371/c0_g1_i1/m.40182
MHQSQAQPQSDLGYDAHNRATKPPVQRPASWLWDYIVHIALGVGLILTIWFVAHTIHSNHTCSSDDLYKRTESFVIPLSSEVPKKGLAVGIQHGRVSIDIVPSDATTVQSEATLAAVHESSLSKMRVQYGPGVILASHPRFSIYNCFKSFVTCKVPVGVVQGGDVPIKVVATHAHVVLRGSVKPHAAAKSKSSSVTHPEPDHSLGDINIKIKTGDVHLENIRARRIKIVCESCEVVTLGTVEAYHWDVQVSADGSWLDSVATLRGPIPKPTAEEPVPTMTFKSETGSVHLRHLVVENGEANPGYISIATGFDVRVETTGFFGKYVVATTGTVVTPSGSDNVRRGIVDDTKKRQIKNPKTKALEDDPHQQKMKLTSVFGGAVIFVAEEQKGKETKEEAFAKPYSGQEKPTSQ